MYLRYYLVLFSVVAGAVHLSLTDAHDQTGTVQRPRAADTELGTFSAQVPSQEPGQTQGAEEEEHEEGVHAVPSAAA